MLSQSRFVLKIVNQASFYACAQREISVPTEHALGHLRCRVTDMPPQPNSPSGRCLETRLPQSHKGDAVGAVLTTVRSSDGLAATSRRSRLNAEAKILNPEGSQPKTGKNHWSLHSISEATFRVVVFHLCLRFHLYYTSDVAAQSQTGVKLNRVFFPRLALQVRSLDCRFAR